MDLSSEIREFNKIKKYKRNLCIGSGAIIASAALILSKLLLVSAPLLMIPGFNLLWSAVLSLSALIVVAIGGAAAGYGAYKAFGFHKQKKEYDEGVLALNGDDNYSMIITFERPEAQDNHVNTHYEAGYKKTLRAIKQKIKSVS